MLRLLAFLFAMFLAVPAAAQLGTGPKHMQLALVAEGPAVPGREVEVALVMTPEEGWHGYWENPGDAGKPMSVAWQLPPGASAGPLRYPVPTRLTVAGLMNHVFKGQYAVLSRLKVPADARGTLPIRATLDYLVCTDEVCVPERGEVALDLAVGSSPADTRFDLWRARLPQPLGSKASFATAGDRLHLAIPLPESVAVKSPYLYAVTGDIVRYADAQRFRRTADRLIAELPLAEAPTGAFDGVIDLGTGRALRFTATPGAVPDGGRTVGDEGETWRLLLIAFLGAVLGGLILNLMPCVFPILALKALALARAGGEEREARADALGYTAGAIVGTGALGAVLLVLRAGGSAAGWAFQLQDPRTVLVLALLGVAITLNLLGLFKLPVLGGDGNPRGGFATGALAAFVATPCAGPFMGAALGSALLLPAAGALLVFAGLGLGLALPFLLLAFAPSLRKRLPRPGPWMLRLQRVLAIPMALSAAAAFWLLGRQGGQGALLAGLAVAFILALVLLLVGRTQNQGRRAWPIGLAGTALALAGALLLPSAVSMTAPATASGEAWSEARVAAARAQNRPVFVYFTADWCLSCKVNETSTINRANVRQSLKAANAAVLVADWTNADPAITRFLDSRGRGAIPLYLWYAPGAAEPEELPQVLTPAMLTERANSVSR
jgi:DsbC/DsbD-like thiol-disulfide interchange protein/cytochrome c biogenesis protein CcdA